MKTKSGLFIPSPLQNLILEHLRTKGRDSAQGIAQGIDTTVGSARDALKGLRRHGLVDRSPVSFELAKCLRKPATTKRAEK
jgi:DNA-binding MarR family transcriptional regulator